MKVVILGPAYPYRGGLAVLNERLASELQQNGHDVKLYTFTLQYPNFLFPGKTQFSDKTPPSGIEITQAINSINPVNWIKVGNQIKKEKPDLVLLRFWIPFFGASFGKILRQIKSNQHSKVIAIIDNMIPHESRIGDQQLTNYFIKPVDGFIAMTNKVLEDIKVFDQSKPKLISPHPLFDNYGNPISREKALGELKLDPGYQYILFFGLIRKYKGLDLLIEAFADKRFRNRKLKLIIAGEYYTELQPYQELIEKLGLSHDVIHVNEYIPDEQIKYYFCASDLLVLPYKSATQSGVTQVAYHFNTPMIVTNVGGLAETCPHEQVGYVVEPNIESISNGILRFYEEEMNESFRENIIQEKKKYSWDVLIDNILKLYQQL